MANDDEQTIRSIQSAEQLARHLSCSPRVILNCYAPWAAPCAQISEMISALSKRPTLPHDTSISYLNLEPETVPALLKKYKIKTVPTVLFFSASRLVRRIEGADATALTTSARWLSSSSDDALLQAACEMAVSQDVVLVMKGDPANPKCGFCKYAVEILRKGGIVFEHVDVLGDADMREMLKKVYNWSTYPMLFARGRLVGGLDRLREVADSGLLIKELAGEGVGEVPDKESINDRLKRLVKSEKVMLFMKGSPDAPRCGFSRRIVELLREQDIHFSSFDILGDQEVRQGLKEFSDWPTFPQLYSQGTFVGGLDVVKELVDADELKSEMGLE